MRERMNAVGGTLEAGPTAGGGFLVTARVPVAGIGSVP
jgi:signal transduction histidine kinase